jgi:hypothetical protein
VPTRALGLAVHRFSSESAGRRSEDHAGHGARWARRTSDDRADELTRDGARFAAVRMRRRKPSLSPRPCFLCACHGSFLLRLQSVDDLLVIATSVPPSVAASAVLPSQAMSEPRKLRCYQYVPRPFGEVRELLRQRPLEVFRHATTTAAERASAIAANLHAVAAGLDVGVGIAIRVQGVHDEEGVAGVSPVTRVVLVWEAARSPAFFPVMQAELVIWPLTSTETQLEIVGAYRPPLGIVGNAVDAALGHRVAEAVVQRFLEDVAQQVGRELPPAR